MSVSTGFAPRDLPTRLQVGRHLLGLATEPPPPDADGYLAACSAIAGRPAPAAGPGDGVALQRLGLAGPVPADAPLVSILICTFNRAVWLREAIASAQAQDWPCEIVVVDDGSTDDTEAVLATTAGVLTLRHAQNRGKPAALELGMGVCRGEAVLVLDDDDKLLPGAIRTLAAALFADDSLVAVYGETLVFDDATGDLLDWRPATRLPGSLTRRAALTTIPAMPGATLIRMAAQVQLAPFEPSLVRGQDMDHFLRLSALGPMAAVPVPIQLYRRHDGLRGAAGARWKKHTDPAEHRRRFLGYVQPVFRERWLADRHDRAEGFAWALGLAERDLPGLAAQELARWPLPDSPHEAWIRERVGQRTRPAPADGPPWLILDDGDDGALVALLAELDPHAPVEVVLPRAHDSVAHAQVFWPGVYRVESTMTPRRGPVRLASSASPEWRPPVVDASWVPAIPQREVAPALSAITGWAVPSRSRAPRCAAGALMFTQRCAAMRSSALNVALAATADVLERFPTWTPARALGAAVCRHAGLENEATALGA
jgi:hypothetical protein